LDEAVHRRPGALIESGVREQNRLLGSVWPYRRLAALSLVFLVLLVVGDLAIPRLVQRIIDEGIRKGDRAVVVSTALVMLAVSAVSAVIAVASNALSVRVGESVARDLREALFVRIQGFSFANLDRHKIGELMVRLTSDVAAFRQLVQVSLRIGTRAPLMMLGSVALMIATSSALALTMLPVLLVTGALIGWFVLRMEPLYRGLAQRLDVLSTVLQENVTGARLVKALVRGAHEAGRFEAANEEMTARAVRVMKVGATMTPLLTMCMNVGIVIVVWHGGVGAMRGELTLGQIVAFSNYMLTTMTPLLMTTMLSNTWAAGLASSRRIAAVLKEQPAVVDCAAAKELRFDAPPSVSFRDVGFSYGQGAEPVLEHVSFEVAPGTTVAVLGSTGAGKSTLVSLVPRFYDPTRGSVGIAGEDARALAQRAVGAFVAVAPQDTFLFSGTVRDNIRYGRPDATDDEVVAAARVAQAHEFVERLPHGYDSRIEQRGGNLSGGQKQRLAIARALVVRPRVLVLDDSTSAVDVETETRIQDALAETGAERTTFVVAQRVSTVLAADTILVLDKGRVVASGTHAELLRTSELYREIAQSQLGALAAEPHEGEP